MTNSLPLSGLVPPEDELPTFSAPKTPQQQYEEFMGKNPQLSHIPFDTWLKEASQLQTAAAEQMAATRQQMVREGQGGVGPVGAQLMGPGGSGASMQELAKLYNIPVESMIGATQLPAIGRDVGGSVGSLVDFALGQDKPADQGPGGFEAAFAGAGEGLPRAVGSMFMPGGLITASADVAAQTLARGGDTADAARDAAIMASIGKLAQAGGAVGEKFVGQQITRAMRPTGGLDVAQDVNRQLVREALTGITPKIGQVTGQAVGAGVGSVGFQSLQGQDPLSPESIAGTLTNVAMTAAPGAYNAVKNSNAYNQRAADTLAKWWYEKQSAQPEAPVLPANAAERAEVVKLIEESSSIPDRDIKEWRKSVVIDGLKEMRTVQDPVARDQALTELTNAVVEGRNLQTIGESAEREVLMSMIRPPKTVEELTTLSRRINTLIEDSLRLTDERVAAGDTEVTSSAAFRQLRSQGHMTQKIDLDWLEREFGQGVEMSLTNSNATAYSILVNKMVGKLAFLANNAKKVRDRELTEKSVQTEDPNRNSVANRELVKRFFTQLSKVPNEYQLDPATGENFITKLMDRFAYHEDNDNRYDTGEGNRFLTEVGDLIESISMSVPPEQYGQIDWAGIKAPQEREIREIDPETETEQRVRTFKDVSLGEYLNKDFEGKYTLRVTGRSSRSQKEIPLSETGLDIERTVPRGQEALSEQELYGVREKETPVEQMPAVAPEVAQDWTEHSDKVRTYIANTEADQIWRAVAPAFVKPGAMAVHKRTENRFRPIIKDFVLSLYETGVTKSGTPTQSYAAEKLVKDLNLPVRKGSTAGQAVLEFLRTSLMQSGVSVNDFKTELVRRIAGAAGVDVPQSAPGVLEAWLGKGEPNKWSKYGDLPYSKRIHKRPYFYRSDQYGKYKTLFDVPPDDLKQLGASSGLGAVADAYTIVTQTALNNGLSLAEAEPFVKTAMMVMNTMNLQDQPVAKISKYEAYEPPEGSRMWTPSNVDTVPKAEAFLENGLLGFVMPSEYVAANPVMGIAYDHIISEPNEVIKNRVLHMLVSAMLHEAVHTVQFAVQTPKSSYPGITQEQREAYLGLNSLGKLIGEEGRTQVLKNLAIISLPKSLVFEKWHADKPSKMHHAIDALIHYGAKERPGRGSDEFPTVAAQFIGLGMLTGHTKKLDPVEIFETQPDEVTLAMKAMYRNVHLNADIIREVLGATGAMSQDVVDTIELVHKIVVAKDLQVARAEVDKLYSSLRGGSFESLSAPFIITTGPALSPRFLEGLSKPFSRTEQELIQNTYDSLFRPSEIPNLTQPWPKDQWEIDYELGRGGPGKPPKFPTVTPTDLPFPEQPKAPTVVIRPDVYVRSVMLMNQALDHVSRRGLPLAQEMIKAVNKLVPSERRMTMGMFAPFMTTDGKFDPNNVALQMMNDRTEAGVRDRAMLNRIAKWAQENGEMPFVENEGVWSLSENATENMGLGLGQLSQRVVHTYLTMTQAMSIAADQIYSSQVNSVANRVARMLITIHPPDLPPIQADKAFDAADKLVRGLAFQNQRLATDGLEGMLPHARDTVMSFMNSGVLGGLLELRKQFDDRGSWFLTEQRPGEYLVKGVDQDKKTAVDGAENMIEVNKLRRLYESKGYTDIEVISKSEKARYAKYESPEGVLNRYVEAEQAYWQQFLDANPKGLTPEQLQVLRSYAPAVGEGVAGILQKRSIGKFMVKRRSVPSVAGLDYVSAMLDYIPRLAGTISRRAVRQNVELILADPRMANQEPFANYMRNQLEAALYPSQKWERNAQSFTAGWYMAANLSSMLVNGSDVISILPSTLIRKGPEGYSQLAAGKHTSLGMRYAFWANRKENQGDIERLSNDVTNELREAAFVKRDPRKFTADEIRAYAAYNAVQMQQIDKGLLHDVFEEADFKGLAARAFALRKQAPSPTDLVADPMYRVVRGMMYVPRMTHQFNNYTSFFAGVEQAIEMGMGPQEALNHGDLIRTLSLGTGGKTNAPGYMGAAFKGVGLSTVRVFHTLQQYAYNVAGLYYSNIMDSFSDDKNLTEAQRTQAAKSARTLIVTQATLAGLMGLPLVAALMTLFKELTSVDPETETRKGLAYLAGADEDNTGFRGVVTELAMNGAPNQMFGVAVGQRLGTSSFLGFSPYEGFNLMDMAATPSLISGMYDGLGYLSQGQTAKAATSLAPNFLRRYVEMASNRSKYGDWQFRNAQGKPIYDPSVMDMLRYGIGFDPSRLSEAKRKDRLIRESDKIYARRRERELQEAAIQYNQGNRAAADAWVKAELDLDPSKLLSDPMGSYRAVADRASELQQVRDPLASTPLGNSPEAKAIAQTYPPDLTERRSELDANLTRIQKRAGVGAPMGQPGQSIARGAMLDALIQKGLTRAEAEQQLRMMGL